MKALADSVSKLARPLIGRRGFTQAEILLQWAAIVGEDLARMSVPVKLSFPKREGGARTGGILHLKVEPAAALEIQHMEPQILARVNLYCGYQAVMRIVMRQGPLPPRPRAPMPPRPLSKDEEHRLFAATGKIVDPDLRAALERLGRAVLGTALRKS